MIVDSSALIAVLQNEPEAERFVMALADDPAPRISAATWLEASVARFRRGGEAAVRDFDLAVVKLGIEVVAVTPKQAEIARRAFLRYGKGVHPAGLNFGDCFAYALSKESGEPLLFKGDDFSRTDVAVAPY